MKKYKRTLILLAVIAAAVLWWLVAARVPDRGMQLISWRDSSTVILAETPGPEHSEAEGFVFSAAGYLEDPLTAYLAQSGKYREYVRDVIRPAGMEYRVERIHDSLRITGEFTELKGPFVAAGYSLVENGDTLRAEFQFITAKGSEKSGSTFTFSTVPLKTPSTILICETVPPSLPVIQSMFELDRRLQAELISPAPGYSPVSNRIDPSYPLKISPAQKEKILELTEAYARLLELMERRLELLRDPALVFEGKDQQIADLLFWKEEARNHLLGFLLSARCYTLAGEFVSTEPENDMLRKEKRAYLSLRNYYSRLLRF
ncbi:MAG: hypothetical protein ACOYXB_01630 [Bacteroidota bacterium]